MPPRTARVSRRSKSSAANRAPRPPAIFNVSHDSMALICDLLLPADMLSLYRTCKTVRAFLQQGTSKMLWKAARANVEDLPACPDWLTEPQFASLCFDEFCFRCLAVDESSKSPIWVFFARYCVACKEQMLTSKNPLEGFALSGVLADFRSRLSDVFPTYPTCDYLLESDDYVWIDNFHAPDVERLRSQLAMKIPLNDRFVSTTNKVTLSTATQASILALLNDKQADTKARRDFATQCRSWDVQWKFRQRLALMAIKAKRRMDILTHLQDLGYTEEVRDLGPGYEGFSDDVFEFVDKARPLTQREWNAIRPEFTAFMDWRRELESRAKYVRLMVSRLRLLQRAILEHFHEEAGRDKRFDGARVFPTLLDLLDVRDAANLISLPDGAVLLSSLWVACLPKFAKAWEEARAGALVSLLDGLDPSSSPANFAQPSLASADMHPITARIRSAVPCLPLLHPSALFWCDVCASIVPGIVAMSHTCCYGRDSGDTRDILTHLNATLDGTYSQAVTSSDSDDYLYKKTVIAFSEGILPWSHDKLHGCLHVARSILKTCGVVVDDLLKELRNVENARLACKTCCQDGKCVLAMGWLRAISHAFEVHGGHEGSWGMLPLRLVEKVKNTEYAARRSIEEGTHARARWECTRCSWEHPEAVLAYTWPQLVEHFTDCHPFTDLNPTWYRASRDSPPFMHPAVLLVERGAQVDIPEDEDGASFPRKHLVVQMKLPKDIWTQLFS